MRPKRKESKVNERLKTAALWGLCLLVGAGSGAGVGGVVTLVGMPLGLADFWMPVFTGAAIGLICFLVLGILVSPTREKRNRDAQMMDAEHALER